MTVDEQGERAAALLRWADETRRDLPWRRTRDPWAILLSEVMLQQTQVSRVEPRYLELVGRWPTAVAMAGAPLDEVLRAWSGLGYPRRAKHLQGAARLIAERHDGRVPDSLEELLGLPGVGPYTARAVLVFAFERDVGVVDTNVGRILARWQDQRLAPNAAQDLADRLVPRGASWRWNQGLMDLGATHCRPAMPDCERCPVTRWCGWAGDPARPDPSVRSAAVSRPQARFEGSDRQARGALLSALGEGPRSDADAGAIMGVDDSRAARLVHDLEREGLLSRRSQLLYLGQGPATEV